MVDKLRKMEKIEAWQKSACCLFLKSEDLAGLLLDNDKFSVCRQRQWINGASKWLQSFHSINTLAKFLWISILQGNKEMS